MAPKAEEPITIMPEAVQAAAAPEVLTASIKALDATPVEPVAVVVETVETEEEPAPAVEDASPEVSEKMEEVPLVLVPDNEEEQLEQTAAKAAMCSTWDFAGLMSCCGIASVFPSAEAKREKLENEKATKIQTAARSMIARKTAKTLKEEKEAAAAAAEAEAKAASEAKAAAEAEAAAAEAAKEQALTKSSGETGKKSFLQKLQSLFSGCKNSKSQVVEQVPQ